ncbi:MAG TPA: transglutaminase family protein, partial [Polyangiaceae bacterium]|nr:transglutaminase family protein [Polyangiaceae bacterium]
MSIRVALQHATRYEYDRLVTLSPHVVRLRPAPHCRTPIVAYSLWIKPEPHFLNWHQDPFGNYQARIVFPKPTREFSVEVDLVAEMTVINPFDFFIEEYAEHCPFTYAPKLRRDLAPYLERVGKSPTFDDFVERARSREATSGRRMVDVLVGLNQQVQKSLRYDIRMEPGVFTPEETLTRGHGSCRDFAWLLVQTLRALGFAARFVSGYSIQLRADEVPVVGPAGVSTDSTDLHAWAEVFLPGAGWVGLDATSGLLAGEGHIPLACTPDPETAAAVTGSYAYDQKNDDDKIDEKFAFSMSVRRVKETPRVTLPYTDEQWQQIVELGHRVDASLEQNDVRLTMGGEPTFVAAADPDADEWNTTADGPTKRRYAADLARRLLARFVPGALLHEGQGKWYPGEPLPRWAMSCYFRKDGEAIWQDRGLFAGNEGGTDTHAEASVFVTALARRLGVESSHAAAAYEDAWYHLWRERRLPVNVDPHESKLENAQDRARLARIFEQGLAQIVGYALPIHRVTGPRGLVWQSGPWFFRSERMYLLPGDSPMGFRLPLDSLPWVAPGDYPHLYERDPFAPRSALPTRDELGRSSPARPPFDRRPAQHAGPDQHAWGRFGRGTPLAGGGESRHLADRFVSMDGP